LYVFDFFLWCNCRALFFVNAGTSARSAWIKIFFRFGVHP
jgi:hypothetical protein